MINNFSQWIANHPKLVVIVCFLLVIPAAIGYLNTGINYDILTYLPDDLNSVKGEQILDETFHCSASSFVIIDGAKAKDVVALKEKISGIDGVSKVLWTDSVLDISVPVSMLPDEVADIFYSKDKNTTMMMVFYSGSGSSGETLAAVAKIKLLLAENQFICGISAISADTKDTVEHDAPIFVVVAVALALFILSFTMGSWALPPIVMISLGVGIVLNMGSNIFMGEVSYITRSIGAILQLGVTMDFSVFLIDRYEEEKAKTPLHRQAMANAIAGTFTSLTGSAMATFFGFIAMCFMSFTLGFDLGIVMAKGVLFGVLSVLTLLPSLMLLFDRALEKTRHRRLIPRFDKINAFTIKHKRVAALLFFILLIPAFILQNKVDIYYNMDRALSPDSDSIVALHKMKDAFNMATTQFIIVDADLPASDMTALTESVKSVDGVNAVISLNSFLGSAIPTSILPEEIKEICVKDNMQLMLINSNYNAATDEENAQVEKLEEIVSTYDKEGYVTGEGAMTKDLAAVNTRDLAVTRIISIGAIFLVIAICLQSLSIPVLLVAAIELAIMINLACSYITGTSIPFIAPTIIECIQLGSTVNYAILLTVRFREEIRAGKPRKEAILKAANESDRSIIQSAMVFFVATFGVYLVCDMPMIKSICILLARGAIISTVVIIGILTPLLLLLEKYIDKTSLRWSKATGTEPNTVLKGAFSP